MSSITGQRANLAKRIYMRIAELLGIGIFKRYWPAKGSYWNSVHHESTSADSMRSIMLLATDFGKAHLHSFLCIIFIMMIIYVLDINTGSLGVSGCLVLLIYETAAMSISYYNYIRASDMLAQLLERQPEPAETPKSRGLKVVEFGNYHTVSITWFGNLGPLFETEETAKEYMQYLNGKFTGQTLLDAIFLNKKQLYLDWLAAKAKKFE